MRLHYYRLTEEAEPELVNVSQARRLLKSQDGKAWTEHYDRDGGLFEVTPIIIEGSNKGTAYDDMCIYDRNIPCNHDCKGCKYGLKNENNLKEECSKGEDY